MADIIIDDNTDKKIIRRNKKLFYHNERNQILNKLIQLINFNNDAQENKQNLFSGARRDKSILLVQLKDNQELINYLSSITDNIKKYYRCSTWVVKPCLQPYHFEKVD